MTFFDHIKSVNTTVMKITIVAVWPTVLPLLSVSATVPLFRPTVMGGYMLWN